MLQGAAQGMDGVFPLEATAGIIESCHCFHHLLLNIAQIFKPNESSRECTSPTA